tara:strand:- start:630 stop:1007 length:378 start_codon:yes stop_codon:yes gene_type:complete
MNVRQLIKALIYTDSSRNLLAYPTSEDGKEHLNKKVVFKWNIDRPLFEKIDDAAFSESWSDEEGEDATFYFDTLFLEFEGTTSVSNYDYRKDEYVINLKLKDLDTNGSQSMQDDVKKVVEEIKNE